MSAVTHHSITGGQFIPGPDFVAYQDEQGGWRAYQSFACLESSLSLPAFRNTFAAGVAPRVLDSSLDSYWDGLGLSYVSWDREPGGRAKIRVYYAGIVEAPAPQYTLRGELTERSLLEHPTVKGFGMADRDLLETLMFGRLPYRWNATSSKVEFQVYTDDPSTWVENDVQPSTATVQTWAQKILGGIRTYRFPVKVYSKRWKATSGVGTAANALGEIDTPSGSPTKPSGTDWMLATVYERQQGNLFDNELTWELSDSEGHDTDIY